MGCWARSTWETLGWEAPVPQTDDYDVEIVNTGGDEIRYSIEIDVPARLGPGSGPVQTGGQIVGCADGEYLFRLDQPGRLSVAVTSRLDDLVLDIMGMSDRNPYLRSTMMAAQWSGDVPAQEYLIRVVPKSAVMGQITPAFQSDFTLEISTDSASK